MVWGAVYDIKTQFLENVSKDTDSHSKNGVPVREYELILWGIEAIPYILHLSTSKPSKIELFQLFYLILSIIPDIA